VSSSSKKKRKETPNKWISSSESLGYLQGYLTIARGGLYQIRVLIRSHKGNQDQIWQIGESTSITIPGGIEWEWREIGNFTLEQGINALQATIPPFTDIANMEANAMCASPIEPKNGWQPENTLTCGALSQTLVRLLQKEHKLPVGKYKRSGQAGTFVNKKGGIKSGSKQGTKYVSSIGGRAELTYNINVPDDDMYALSVRLTGSGRLRWGLNGCAQATTHVENPSFAWSPGLYQTLKSGRHTLSLAFYPGIQINSIQVNSTNFTPTAAVQLMNRLGFQCGDANQPVTKKTLLQILQHAEIMKLIPTTPSVSDIPSDLEYKAPQVTTEEYKIDFPFDNPASPVLPQDLS